MANTKGRCTECGAFCGASEEAAKAGAFVCSKPCALLRDRPRRLARLCSCGGEGEHPATCIAAHGAPRELPDESPYVAAKRQAQEAAARAEAERRAATDAARKDDKKARAATKAGGAV